jgi:hypothetical protein
VVPAINETAEEDGVYSVLINSGFYDNRSSVKNLTSGDRFIFRLKIRDESGNYLTNTDLSGWDISLRTTEFNTNTGSYDFPTQSGENLPKKGKYGQVSLLDYSDTDKFIFGECVVSFSDNIKLTDEEFKKAQIKLVIKPPVQNETSTYYLEKMEFYKRYEKGDSYIKLNDEEEEIETTTFVKRNFFLEDDLFGDNVPASAEELNRDTTEDLTYETYKPYMFPGAVKQRSIKAKESNYFNILQTIAETFEAWLELKISRDERGAVT